MLIHDWLDRVAFSMVPDTKHHLHCAIKRILPAPRALRPRCRLFLTEFGVPTPLMVIVVLVVLMVTVVVVMNAKLAMVVVLSTVN